jgi:hypothetical protein
VNQSLSLVLGKLMQFYIVFDTWINGNCCVAIICEVWNV